MLSQSLLSLRLRVAAKQFMQWGDYFYALQYIKFLSSMLNSVEIFGGLCSTSAGNRTQI